MRVIWLSKAIAERRLVAFSIADFVCKAELPDQICLRYFPHVVDFIEHCAGVRVVDFLRDASSRHVAHPSTPRGFHVVSSWAENYSKKQRFAWCATELFAKYAAERQCENRFI